MRKFALAVLAVLLSAQAGWSQTADRWSTAEECIVAAPNSPFYAPQTQNERKLGAGEYIAPNPSDACVLMALPGVETKWVKVPKGAPAVFKHGVMIRYLPCNNKVSDYRAITLPGPRDGAMGPAGPRGEQGPTGPAGRDGKDGRNAHISKWVPIGVGAVILGGIAAAAALSRGHSHSESNPNIQICVDNTGQHLCPTASMGVDVLKFLSYVRQR